MGIVAWLDGSRQTGKFCQCVFSNIKCKGGKLIYVEASESIEIVKCCFSVCEDDVVNRVPVVSLLDNQYEASCATPPGHSVERKSQEGYQTSKHGSDWIFRLLAIVSFIVFSGSFLLEVNIATL